LKQIGEHLIRRKLLEAFPGCRHTITSIRDHPTLTEIRLSTAAEESGLIEAGVLPKSPTHSTRSSRESRPVHRPREKKKKTKTPATLCSSPIWRTEATSNSNCLSAHWWSPDGSRSARAVGLGIAHGDRYCGQSYDCQRLAFRVDDGVVEGTSAVGPAGHFPLGGGARFWFLMIVPVVA